MCLGVPARITDIVEVNGLRMGTVDFGGVSREVCLAYVPEAIIGDYTIIHVGFALNVISEEDALETLRMLQEISDLGEQSDLDESEIEQD